MQHFVSKTKPNVFEKNPDHSKFPEVRRQRLAPWVHIVPNRDIVLPKTLNTSAQVLTHVNKALMKTRVRSWILLDVDLSVAGSERPCTFAIAMTEASARTTGVTRVMTVEQVLAENTADSSAWSSGDIAGCVSLPGMER